MQLSVSLLDKPDLEHAVLKPACCESPKEKNKPQAGNHKSPTISPASNIGGGDPSAAQAHQTRPKPEPSL